MDYVKAFLIGGLICALVQILMEKTKMMPGRIMVTLVVTGCILGAIGIYEPFLKWAGAGAGVPLLGFGHWERRGAGDFQRRPDSQLGRDMRGSGLRIPGFPGV